jgi:hypothetical protein
MKNTIKVLVAEWRASGHGMRTAGANQFVVADRESGTLTLEYEGWSATGQAHTWENKFSQPELNIPVEVVKTSDDRLLTAYILYGYSDAVRNALKEGLFYFNERHCKSNFPYPGKSDLQSLWVRPAE